MSVLSRLQAMFGESVDATETEAPPIPEADLNLACAALLVEVARADYADDPRETEATCDAIRVVLDVPEADITELMDVARVEVAEGTSLYPHTKLINDHCSREQKYNILIALWRVAFADGNLDKYEEHLIRRVADLIHMDHTDFIHAKIAARDG